MEKTVLVLEDVTVAFGSKIVLKDISFEVREGEFWGIIGPNGGGKTTLLKTILGLIKPVKGTVSIMGLSPKEAVRKGYVGYLPQRIENYLPLSCEDVVSLVVSEKREIERLLELVGMKDKREQPFSSLSGGEKQRILIAMVLAKKPRLLLLDEPNTGIDIVAQDAFYELLRRIKVEENVSILMVSHDVGVIVNFVDRVACLNRTLHYEGDPRGVLDCDLLKRLYGTDVEVFVHHPECKGCHVFRTS